MENNIQENTPEEVTINSPILQAVKGRRDMESDGVIYGVYDNKNKGLFQRLNDFLIDHSKVTLKDKSYFFHMLAVMVDAGIPVVSAVKSIAERTENRRFQRVLRTIAYNAEHGLNLSDAMTRYSDVFDESEIGIVRSGEATGRLQSMLFKLSDRLDKRNDLNSKVFSASIYPIAVFSVLILVAIGMLGWVFPTLLNLLQEGGLGEESLPLATRVLIVIQNIVVGYWWLILLLLFGAYGLFLLYVSTEYGLIRWHYFLMRLPVVGKMMRKLYVLRTVDILGLLIESGVPVLKALEITGNSIKNRVYREKIQEVIERVKTGAKISDSLADASFLYPPEVVQMINVGEGTASLGSITQKVAVQYEKELDNSLKRLTSLFEPLMILVVAIFVALLALAIMSPIFNLGSTVGA